VAVQSRVSDGPYSRRRRRPYHLGSKPPKTTADLIFYAGWEGRQAEAAGDTVGYLAAVESGLQFRRLISATNVRPAGWYTWYTAFYIDTDYGHCGLISFAAWPAEPPVTPDRPYRRR
jgi:hypothetical protein